MVSYFVPRGRFLIKVGNFRQSYQKQQQPLGRWPLLRHLHRTFSTKSKSLETDSKVDLIQKKAYRTSAILNKSGNVAHQHEHLQQRPRNIWSKWTGMLLRWSPVGLCVFGAIEWQLHKLKCQREDIPRIASSLQAKVYCSLPLRIISRCWGWLAACNIPITLRPYVYGWYSRAFNVNLDEAMYPNYEHYNSLAEFFTRPLRDDVREIDKLAPLVSPADGKVLHFGTASNSLIEQVKGVNYSIESFLGPPTWTEKYSSLYQVDYANSIKEKRDGSTTLFQCVIYLAPGDYHRFHSPAEWQPIVRRHFSGELLSVSPKIATWLPDLFCLNERALYLGKWEYGFFSYTAVGATNVGSVQIYMDEQLKTNRWIGFNVGTHKNREQYDEQTIDTITKFKKGDLVGQFNMGSTIVLLFEAPRNFQFTIEAGQKIRVGEPLGFIDKK